MDEDQRDLEGIGRDSRLSGDHDADLAGTGRLKHSFGKEWVVSEPEEHEFITEALALARSRVNGLITKQLVVGHTSDAHFRLDCENTRPHTHIFLRWDEYEPA